MGQDIISTLYNAIYTVLGGFISGLVGIALERRRERKRTELKHFNVLKSKVLKPVLNELAELKSYFMFGEGGSILSSQRLDEELNSEFTWWKYYPLVDRARVNRDLFEDLKNHFPKLYNDLKYVESWMRTKYPEYLHLLRDLLKRIENDSQFKEFEEELKKHVQETKVYSSIDPQALHDMAVNIVLYLILDIEVERWPNVYRITKPLLSKAVVIKSRYQNSEEVQQKLKHLMNEITSILDRCIQSIDKIMYMTKLPKVRRGKCEFI